MNNVINEIEEIDYNKHYEIYSKYVDLINIF